MSEGEIRRFYIKHKAQPTVFAIERDKMGYLAALEVTDSATKQGLCPHLLASLPLTNEPGLLAHLERTKTEFELYEPECGNVHHLMNDLIELERDYRDCLRQWTQVDLSAKALKKLVDSKGEKVHELLERIYNRPTLPLFDDLPPEGAKADEDGQHDELFDEAARIVVSSGEVSVSYLQRKLRIGFSRAARLVDMMEADGLVSSGASGKPREVLVDRTYFDEKTSAGA
jgi:hypothetical protein